MGSGGVGGYFGARLARDGHVVKFIARGAHLQALQRRGLVIKSAVDGEWRVDCDASDHVEQVDTADLVLFCVKSPDTESSARLVSAAVSPETIVLSLQNGVDNELKLKQTLPACHLMGGVAYIFANIIEPGVIAHHQLGSIVLGDLDGGIAAVASALCDVMNHAGIECRADADIISVLWQKYVFLVALSGTTAASRCPAGVIRNTEETRLVWQRQVDELISLAQVEGVNLPTDMVRRCAKILDSLSPDNYSSLYHDLVNGKPLELEALHGHAVRLAARHGLFTPTLDNVYGLLKPWVAGQR